MTFLRTSGKIRDPIRNAADVGEQSWTGTAIQHPKYDTCQQYEITMIILDTPLANLCAGPNTPYALELPFDVSTGTPTVPGYYGCLNCGSSVTECRSYGYGAYDSNRLHYATQQRMNGGNNIQSADACTDYVKYVGFNKTRGNLCNVSGAFRRWNSDASGAARRRRHHPMASRDSPGSECFILGRTRAGPDKGPAQQVRRDKIAKL